jgi:hypothetical protein
MHQCSGAIGSQLWSDLAHVGMQHGRNCEGLELTIYSLLGRCWAGRLGRLKTGPLGSQPVYYGTLRCTGPTQ